MNDDKLHTVLHALLSKLLENQLAIMVALSRREPADSDAAESLDCCIHQHPIDAPRGCRGAARRMKTLASSTSTTEEDRNLETAANEKLKLLGSECRIVSVFTRSTGTGTMHGVAFRGAPIIIEQPRPFSVDELAKAAQLHGSAIAGKSKAQWMGEAGHLPVTVWPGPRDG